MAIDSRYYIHESDRAALDALKAIPGFSQFTKAFMKAWNENQFRILNMSSRIRLSEAQLPKYYAMLEPICGKLGIDVPELYLELNVYPNAYTYGDTKPFIVLTSGLIDTIPEELIPTVLAHECGHIACHHTLYRTMGQMILSGTAAIPGLGLLVTLPLKIAFAYWMRCSEFSADRAAILCEGNADHVVDLCMRLSGYTTAIQDTAQKQAFLDQAVEYRNLVKNNVLNQTMEFMILAGQSHPLTAVRAYEADQWAASGNITKLIRYFGELEQGIPHREIPAGISSGRVSGMNREKLTKQLKEAGFTSITTVRKTDSDGLTPDSVCSLSFGGITEFNADTWFSPDIEIILTYYTPPTAEELRALHPNEIQVPFSASDASGRNYTDVCMDLVNAGFKNVFTVHSPDTRPIFTSEGGVSRIQIGDTYLFAKGDWFAPSAKVRVIHY